MTARAKPKARARAKAAAPATVAAPVVKRVHAAVPAYPELFNELNVSGRVLEDALAQIRSAMRYADTTLSEDLAYGSSLEAIRLAKRACALLDLASARLVEGRAKPADPLCRCGHRRSQHELAETAGFQAEFDECQGVDGPDRDPCDCDTFRVAWHQPMAAKKGGG